MSDQEKVLVIGRHRDILIRVTEMLTQHCYNVIGKQWNEEAIDAFKKEKIKAVIIGGGVDAESRQLFHIEFTKLNPSIKIIDAHPQTVLRELEVIFGRD